ncbi:Vacuolar protein sorting-associated protein 25 [Acorus calamus]|uniref:Vacuolar protein sorting-associated protein 25 n=1 Tax=Acorus calamus TaxID=4465 RepID=A0AAV9CC93_ACOCL|nr:Vacuolar protein sorting-associated protein 25 [Acorus calamus]
MQRVGDFKLPSFFNYPPYFTLQPVRETREKQVQLWKELILDYCRTLKVFTIGLEEDFPLFSNPEIQVRDNGLEDSVMTVEDIRSGIESRGTELEGIDRTVLMRALKLLEQKGKVAIFKGTSADDEGVKFSA